MNALRTALLALTALAAAASAHAETAPISLAPALKPLNLSDARVSIGPPPTGAPPANRTSVEQRFGPDAMMGSLGFLCGLEPHSDRSPGPASTFGPVGTFLGGKLSYAFK